MRLHESGLLDLITVTDLMCCFDHVRLVGGYRKENYGAFINKYEWTV
jgi:hypothetical protein